MPGRMADTLLYLFNEVFDSRKFTPYLSKQDIADLSGMSKDSAIKILREFQKDGIINYSDKELKILKEDVLQRISRTG
jgi:CRP/FNR family transcriptional regulator